MEFTDEEINKQVADKLTPGNHFRGAGGYGYGGPNYCHDIAAAWEIIKYLESFTGAMIWFSRYNINGEEKIKYFMEVVDPYKREALKVEASSVPMVICLAFLKLETK